MGAFWSAMRRMAEPLPRPLASAGKHSIRSVAHTPAARIAMSDKTKVSFMMKNNTSGASLFLLWTCGASLRITVLAVPPVISIIQQDLHLSGTEIGLLFGVPVVLFAIAATPGSTLITRFGVRSTLLTGLAIAAIGGALRGVTSNAWQLYLTSIVMSSGIAIMNRRWRRRCGHKFPSAPRLEQPFMHTA